MAQPLKVSSGSVKIGRKPEIKLGMSVSLPSAEWRLPPVNEVPNFESARSGFWQRSFCWIFIAFGLIFYFWGPSGQSPLEDLMTALKTVLLCGGGALAVIALTNRSIADRGAGVSLAMIKTKLPVDDCSPAKIKIYQSNTLTGSDEGYFWLDEDTLFFKGTQCAFRLNAKDIPPLDEWQPKHRPKSNSGVGMKWLEVKTGPRPLAVNFSFLELDNDHAAHRRSSKLVRQIASWVHEAHEGVIETVLPPLAVHPGLRVSGSWSKEGIISGAVIAVIGTLLAFASLSRIVSPHHLGINLTEALVGITGLSMTFFGARFAVMQQRDKEMRHALIIEEQITQ